MKQTSVEWLAKELESYGDPQICKITWEDLDSLVNQAKAMEKEQIMDAWDALNYDAWDALNYRDTRLKTIIYSSAEEYYNETFKSE